MGKILDNLSLKDIWTNCDFFQIISTGSPRFFISSNNIHRNFVHQTIKHVLRLFFVNHPELAVTWFCVSLGGVSKKRCRGNFVANVGVPWFDAKFWSRQMILRPVLLKGLQKADPCTTQKVAWKLHQFAGHPSGWSQQIQVYIDLYSVYVLYTCIKQNIFRL